MENFRPPDPNSIFFQSAFRNHNQFPPPPPSQFVSPPIQFQHPLVPPPVQQPQTFIPPGRILDPTPNATSALVAGIVAVLFSLAWCKWYGTFAGIISALLALHLSSSGMQMIRTSPDVFKTNGMGSLKAAKILGIISLCICGLWFLGLLVVYFSMSGF